MCVDDLVCQGAEPLFFLDYVSIGKLDPDHVATLVAGIAEGCRQAGCALLGGETAEPGLMEPDDFDLAGLLHRHRGARRCSTGSRVERGRRDRRASPRAGSTRTGSRWCGALGSTRRTAGRVPDPRLLAPNAPRTWRATLRRAAAPTRIYAQDVLAIRGRACRRRRAPRHGHITGGGLPGEPAAGAAGGTRRAAGALAAAVRDADVLGALGGMSDRSCLAHLQRGHRHDLRRAGGGADVAVRLEARGDAARVDRRGRRGGRRSAARG